MAAEPKIRTEFDSAERERVRATLRRYMQEHRIGTPTLQYRIIEADQPLRREIPLSTLQRFITGSHHTQEHHVALCHAFVKDLPYYGEGREVEQLGAALSGFLLETMEGESRQALIKNIETEFAGRFETRTLPYGPGAFSYPPQSDLPDSSLSFEMAADQPWLLVQEFANDLRNYAEAPERRFAYDGVLITAAPLVHVFLRSALTRQPKTYSLERKTVTSAGDNVTVLEGTGMESLFLHETTVRMPARHFRIQMIPSPPQEPRDG